MQARVQILMTLSAEIFGPLAPERTKMDILSHLSWMIRNGKGIEKIFIEKYELLQKEDTNEK